MKQFLITLTVAASMMAVACQADPRLETRNAMERMSLAQVTQQQWDRLASRAIYFGHQSVGEDIIAGVQEIMKAHPHIRLTIARGRGTLPATQPALIHFPIGTNGNPRSKNEAFLQFLETAATGHDGIALFKYCYLDIDASTEVQRLLDDYKRTVNTLTSRHPGLRVLHVTAPLTTVESYVKSAVKSLLSRTTDRDRDAQRSRYNALLLREFHGREPVFDLAAIESTRPDGTRAAFGPSDAPAYSLAPELTSDGGHLNALGRRLVAEQFLVALATIP